MTQPLHITVADDERDMRDYYQRLLPRLGHCVLGAASTGQELIDLCRQQCPDLIITDIKMPQLDGIEAVQQLWRERPVPVILVSALHDEETIQRIQHGQFMGFLVKPIKQADLAPAIALALSRFEQLQRLHQELAQLRPAVEDRQLIDRATDTLMRRAGLDESNAQQRLKKMASEQNVQLVDAARLVVLAEVVYAPTDSNC
jgi:AmiR/NasT family two-component response regulator